jgi:dTDP-4-amino-4,6-dideoxygalactose transaminase
MEMMGWKYNMDDIQAALLINQIERLDGYRKKREDLEKYYREQLEGIEGMDILEGPRENEISGHHLFTVLLPRRLSRDEVVTSMQEKGIGVAVNYRSIHTLTYFRKKFGYEVEDFPVANDIGNRTISLPLYSKLEREDVRTICETLIREIT